MQLKEYKTDEEGGICPVCNNHNGTNEGGSLSADEGSYYTCPICGSTSVLIHNGARFMDKPRDIKDKVIRVYEIYGDPLPGPDYKLICCIEVRLINASPLAKINKTHCQYFERREIIEFMSLNYTEDLYNV